LLPPRAGTMARTFFSLNIETFYHLFAILSR
jgi:hypothetical protein